MKKLESFLLCAALVLTVTACGVSVSPQDTNGGAGDSDSGALDVLDDGAGQSGGASEGENSGQENQGQENQDQENQGQENQGQENQGQENQGQENQGQENQGQENQGQANQGQENQGQENQGQENQGQEEPKENPSDPVGEAEMTVEEAIALVEEMLDQPVSELYAVLGEPISSDYASSCLGPGEDGNLYYDGFTVYTYREGDSEVIQGVE